MIKTYHFLIWGKSLTNILGKSSPKKKKKKKKKKLPKSETHSQKTRNYPIKINKKHRFIAKI